MSLFSCRIALCVLLTSVFATSAPAQAIKSEKIQIQTQTLTGQQFMTGKTDGKPAKITGELRIPGAGADKLPAVLLVHGSGGVGANVHYWAAELNKLGIATFVIDAFTGRGIANSVADQTQLANFAMLYDSFRALEILAKHPRIDPNRIAIMGFSKGAISALYSSMTRFQDLHGPKGATFAAHLAFYPACNAAFIDDTKLTKAPVRIFHGTADNYTPIAPCRDYVARLKSAGADVALIELAGAHHAFDNANINPPRKLPNAVTGRKCSLEEKTPGMLYNKASGQRFSPKDSCIERGTTVGHSPAATAAARQQLIAILKDVFKIK